MGEVFDDDLSNRIGVDQSNVEDKWNEMVIEDDRLKVEIEWNECPCRQVRDETIQRGVQRLLLLNTRLKNMFYTGEQKL